jgi:hypothetical protein
MSWFSRSYAHPSHVLTRSEPPGAYSQRAGRRRILNLLHRRILEKRFYVDFWMLLRLRRLPLGALRTKFQARQVITERA